MKKLFSYLPKRKTYLDEYHRVYYSDWQPEQHLSGPLQYILSIKSLKWAWYIFLAGALIYVVFKSKREQKVIPILPEKSNSSLEFVKTIGKLYQLEGNHKKLVKRKMDLFLTFIRDRFKISTSNIDNDLIDLISLRSGVEKENVNKLFNLYFDITRSQKVSNNELMAFDSQMNQFYNDLNK